jgi:hypothetical protein
MTSVAASAVTSVADRFWVKVEAQDPDECWPWLAYRYPNGYGCFSLDNDSVGAHRVAYVLSAGPIPPGMMVLHTCHRRDCMNPDHLFLGTHADRARHGRYLRGENHPMTRMTNQQVKEMRQRYEDGESTVTLVLDYGVKYITAYEVTHRLTWKSVQ